MGRIVGSLEFRIKAVLAGVDVLYLRIRGCIRDLSRGFDPGAEQLFITAPIEEIEQSIDESIKRKNNADHETSYFRMGRHDEHIQHKKMAGSSQQPRHSFLRMEEGTGSHTKVGLADIG